MSTKIFDTLSPAGRRHISACSSVIMEPHNSLIASKICSTTGRPVSNIYYETSSKTHPGNGQDTEAVSKTPFFDTASCLLLQHKVF